MNTEPPTQVLHFDNLELDTHIRVVIRDGSPVFVAKDVCQALGISNSRDALASLDEDEKGVVSNDTLANEFSNVGNTDTKIPNRGLQFVTESGLYALVFKSRKEAARRFRKWVTAEVLPSLRQRREIRSLPAWLEAMQFHIQSGAPPEVAKVAALVTLGVDATTAAKLALPRAPRVTISTPVVDSPSILDAGQPEALLALLTKGREYPFVDLAAIAREHSLFPRILHGQFRKDGTLSDAANSKFGIALASIARTVPDFRIIGKGRTRRYVLI